jgi:tetratricopeptide (TPR) repeat protein
MLSIAPQRKEKTMIRHVSVVLGLCVLAWTNLAWAQHDQHAAAGTERLGSVRFDNSCAPAVATELNRGVALLHSFEFSSAIDSFNRVLEHDPSCAIAYWGIALCHWGNPFAGIKTGPLLARGLAAAQKGLSTGSPTPRERGFIEAAAALYKDAATVSHRDRTLAYEQAMDRVQRDFPSDIEARMFHALAVNQTALTTDKTYANQLKAGAILEPLFKQYPDHPGLAHYIIHAYDVPALAPKALDAARRYASIAPSAPHALHMPSHTFTRVGSWKESIATNIASEKTSLEQNVIGEALHAMDYQTYAHLQLAQDRRALAARDRAPSTLAKLDPNAMGGAAPPMAGFFAAAAIPARYALERGAWEEAAALQLRPSPFPFVDAITHFARALGAARSGNPSAAKADVEQLTALRDKLAAARDTYWTEQVDIQRRIATAWIAFAEAKNDEGIAMLQAAADAEDATDKSAVTPGPLAPARELLGFMLLDAGKPQEARAAFETTMKKEPGRFRGLYGAARAAAASGDPGAAAAYYTELLELTRDGDVQRPELDDARTFVRR